MTTKRYMAVRDLPPCVIAVLREVGYGAKDIGVVVTETETLSPPSSHGRRGFAAVCKLDDTGKSMISWGSWGGSNMFSRTVDDATVEVPIPRDVALVKGSTGEQTYATVYVHPANMNPALLPPAADVTPKEAKILAIFKSLKSSARPEYLQRAGATAAEILELVRRGYLSRNAAGATSITTSGKNAAARDYY